MRDNFVLKTDAKPAALFYIHLSASSQNHTLTQLCLKACYLQRSKYRPTPVRNASKYKCRSESVPLVTSPQAPWKLSGDRDAFVR